MMESQLYESAFLKAPKKKKLHWKKLPRSQKEDRAVVREIISLDVSMPSMTWSPNCSTKIVKTPTKIIPKMMCA